MEETGSVNREDNIPAHFTGEDLAISMEERMKSENLKTFMKRFAADDSGLSAVEYGLLAAGIVLAISVSLAGIGTNLGTIFTNLDTEITNAAGS